MLELYICKNVHIFQNSISTWFNVCICISWNGTRVEKYYYGTGIWILSYNHIPILGSRSWKQCPRKEVQRSPSEYRNPRRLNKTKKISRNVDQTVHMSYVFCLVSNVLCLMSNVLFLMFNVLCLIWCPMSFVWCSMSFAWCPMSFVWCSMSFVWCSMSFAWCPMSFVWCPMSFVWCPMSFVWCLMSLSDV